MYVFEDVRFRSRTFFSIELPYLTTNDRIAATFDRKWQRYDNIMSYFHTASVWKTDPNNAVLST